MTKIGLTSIYTKANTPLHGQRSVVGYYSFLLTSAIPIVRTFHRRIVFAVLEELAAFRWEEFVNWEIYSVKQVARIVIGCTYPI